MANSYCNPARLAAAIPAEIRSKPLWLTWKAGPEKPDGRFDKIPFYASGVRRHGLQGSDKDRAELVPFEQALKAVEKSPIGADGIGLALLPGCGVVAGDFDSCISGERRIPDNLRPLIEGTYAEISVSGTGIRTLWSGDCKSWKSCANHVEVFGDSGFVTLTGDLLQAEGLAPVPDWARSKINGKGSESVAEQRTARADTWIPPETVCDLRSALNMIDADPYDTWVRIGIALSELGDVGRGLWLDWSSTSNKFNSSEAARKWRTFHPDRTGYQAVFTLAQERGWLNPLSTVATTGAGVAAVGARDSLPDPLPLPKLPPVPEFNIGLLPDRMAEWIGDAADRARFRPDFAAVSGMAALGSIIGRKLGIRLKRCDDWTEYANVWAAIVGPPSALKSPAMRTALGPLKKLQAGENKLHAMQREEFEGKLADYKLRKDAAKKAQAKKLAQDPEADLESCEIEKPELPVPRAYYSTNVNAASLGVLLEQNPNGILLERDELSSLLVGLEDDNESDLRGMLLSGWSGSEGYRFDRILRGVTYLPKFAISMVGGIQPGPLARYVRSAFSGERADGLLQRFQLITWPDSSDFDYIDRWPDTDARRDASDLFARADSFDPGSIGTTDDYSDTPYVRLSPDAQARFVDWYEPFMRARRAAESGDNERAPIAAHFGKYPGLVGKLALILHVADDITSREVSFRTLEKAIGWLDYLTPHARRVYHAVEHPETGAADLLLARLKSGQLPAGKFSARDIYRKGWHGLSDKSTVKAACRLLFDFGWLVEVTPAGPTGGRPADPVYEISPMVHM